MYKLLLAWRYLLTRYIALASIISVTLGVATLVVVNSVMAGFTEEMHKRLHGILSDITFESHSLGGLPNPDWHKQQIREVLGSDVEGITATVQVPAMLNFYFRGQWITRQVNLIGIDEATYADVGDFSKYLQHPENRRKLQFLLRENGYNEKLPKCGWEHRRDIAEQDRRWRDMQQRYEETRRREAEQETADSGQFTPPPPPAAASHEVVTQDAAAFDPAKEQHTGLILGMMIASLRKRDANGDVRDYYLCRPGDDVNITFPTVGSPPKAVSGRFTIVDLYESEMSEYDSTFAFVPLKHLQQMRGMIDPVNDVSSVSSLQIKLRPGTNLNEARDKLLARFPLEQFSYRIQTWRDMQGPLLAAVQMETTILNILLFLIIAVAGFGILATFFMIVVEKTRDIGVLKALGAPRGGVMSIFLSYGVSLGAVGAGAGAIGGVIFVIYINEIASWLEWATGREVFDPTIYYFSKIPAIIHPWTVVWVSLGAILIAVMASVLPALRAARLHPVEALRYE